MFSKHLMHEEHLIFWEHNYKYEEEISRVLENQEKPDNDDTGGENA
jgi:hypothetical protein